MSGNQLFDDAISSKSYPCTAKPLRTEMTGNIVRKIFMSRHCSATAGEQSA